MDGEVLCRDVMPADVLKPDGSMLREVRAFVTTHRLVAFQANPQIEKVLDLALLDPFCVPASRGTLSGTEQLQVRVEGGDAWVNRGSGCGCGSPLRALAPPVDWN